MLLPGQYHAPSEPLRIAIRDAYRMEESGCLKELLREVRLDSVLERDIQNSARTLAATARARTLEQSGLEAFLREYDLSTQEGVLLMCLAEALLRIPDPETAERLIRDRLSQGHWDEHLGASSSLLVNASSWGLLLTGRLFTERPASGERPDLALKHLVSRAGEPIVRIALLQAMRILARQFVLGRSVNEALKRAAEFPDAVRFSYDCLGEAARTAKDAQRYLEAYHTAIRMVAGSVQAQRPFFERPGISIKLSALHPRYEFAQQERLFSELLPRLQGLVEEAAHANIGLTLDAEEADRLEPFLDLFERIFLDLGSSSWEGFGLAVQAYQKRAWPTVQWLRQLSERCARRIPVRLVKGAYWDSEIKRAQELGLDGYPVFTRKAATDVAYLCCARFLMQHSDCFYPQIATHNAYTLAWVIQVGVGRNYELQRLHGMGESLYAALASQFDSTPPVRVYAPVGSHEELLPYLVRRLLENGANSSFINQLADEETDLEQLVENPCQSLQAVQCQPHPGIPLPVDLFAPERKNSHGLDLSDPAAVEWMDAQLQRCCSESWRAAAIVAGEEQTGEARTIVDPADTGREIGQVCEASSDAIERAMQIAADKARDWDRLGGARRAECLLRAAELYEQQAAQLVARIVREGGRTVPDALAEVREAVDFCRYYAVQAQQEFETARSLPGPTGENNELQLYGRGVFACISPWNFPLAIFTGQIAAALAAGDAVVAKPAHQTPLTGYLAVTLLHRAGIPPEVLHFLPGSGSRIGGQLCADRRLSGIAFTGSTDTAWTIQKSLARRNGPIIPFIAETGGQNVMIADSSALPEQLVVDVVRSAFNSAGQRCSALRVLFVQNEIADRVIEMLSGAMEEIRIGDPMLLATDVGPLIDRQAVAGLQQHSDYLQSDARWLQRIAPDAGLGAGHFFAVQAVELDSLARLKKEVFGPYLHVIRYTGAYLEQVIDAVNATGYGLTLGVHSRIEDTWRRVCNRARAGNLYLNRNMIGAVVGAQPFGGEGLSGTGPKAGGPYYLHRFATERTRSVNTAAVGGNASLLSLS